MPNALYTVSSKFLSSVTKKSESASSWVHFPLWINALKCWPSFYQLGGLTGNAGKISLSSQCAELNHKPKPSKYRPESRTEMVHWLLSVSDLLTAARSILFKVEAKIRVATTSEVVNTGCSLNEWKRAVEINSSQIKRYHNFSNFFKWINIACTHTHAHRHAHTCTPQANGLYFSHQGLQGLHGLGEGGRRPVSLLCLRSSLLWGGNRLPDRSPQGNKTFFLVS